MTTHISTSSLLAKRTFWPRILGSETVYFWHTPISGDIRRLADELEIFWKQTASDQKLQSLRAKVEKMQDFQSVQTGVLRTIAGEQKVLRQICVARAAMQKTTTASLQHLSQLEQICGTKIQKAFSLVDTERKKELDKIYQV